MLSGKPFSVENVRLFFPWGMESIPPPTARESIVRGYINHFPPFSSPIISPLRNPSVPTSTFFVFSHATDDDLDHRPILSPLISLPVSSDLSPRKCNPPSLPMYLSPLLPLLLCPSPHLSLSLPLYIYLSLPLCCCISLSPSISLCFSQSLPKTIFASQTMEIPRKVKVKVKVKALYHFHCPDPETLTPRSLPLPWSRTNNVQIAQKQEISRERIDFKFSHFHTVQVPTKLLLVSIANQILILSFVFMLFCKWDLLWILLREMMHLIRFGVI